MNYKNKMMLPNELRLLKGRCENVECPASMGNHRDEQTAPPASGPSEDAGSGAERAKKQRKTGPRTQRESPSRGKGRGKGLAALRHSKGKNSQHLVHPQVSQAEKEVGGRKNAGRGNGQRCEHGLWRRNCKKCGSKSFCEHGRQRRYCKDCGGEGFCEHGRRRDNCKECGGGSICEHGRRRDSCKECGGSQICEHGRRRYRCKECEGGGVRGNQRQKGKGKEGSHKKNGNKNKVTSFASLHAQAAAAAAAAAATAASPVKRKKAVSVSQKDIQSDQPQQFAKGEKEPEPETGKRKRKGAPSQPFSSSSSSSSSAAPAAPSAESEDGGDEVSSDETQEGSRRRCPRLTEQQEGLKMIKPHKIARQHPSGKGGRTVAVLGSGVEVKKSTIEGAENGLFVTRQFAKDELITEYDGHLYSKSEVSRKSALWLHVTNLAPGPDTLLCSPVKPRKGQGGAGYINDPSLRMTEEGTFAYDPEGRKRKYNAHADVLKEDIKNKEAKAEWNLVLRSIEWINLAVVKEEGEEVAQGPEKKEEGGGESESTDGQKSSEDKKVVQQLKQEED
uniref:SET domain-containing protein n=1 Tax=Chromera velia CCMP2878 TaxID=1169474 RepID=A0A0G4H9C0_9ALVE|eukprot:Cvel_25272.t1-p1 / transcript=Cvel_25272.t1 / gene=Cvel_25272 / organism=Chromera_velia_CCMP2878 / gene_product=hypothetical protein / transcript_product=hypothetical protein / location=Cvel_scaffold2837:9311-11942(+) / protein_length=559 / sequence_SO=supercontig / SO=protein_coding / is_pseudo=false